MYRKRHSRPEPVKLFSHWPGRMISRPKPRVRLKAASMTGMIRQEISNRRRLAEIEARVERMAMEDARRQALTRAVLTPAQLLTR